LRVFLFHTNRCLKSFCKFTKQKDSYKHLSVSVMDTQKIIENTIEFVKGKLEGDSSGHDWWHIYRVWNMSHKIQAVEGGDLFVIDLAALLHDISDWKFNKNESTGLIVVSDWLESQKVAPDVIQKVIYIIELISFKGEGENNKMTLLEGQIVQDADRLDAIGATGVARTFAFGGWKGNEMYNPAIKPVSNMNLDQYKKSKGTTINHFYEKLLLLKDRMNTNTGKQLAENRHAFMELFLNQFHNEWEGVN